MECGIRLEGVLIQDPVEKEKDGQLQCDFRIMHEPIYPDGVPGTAQLIRIMVPDNGGLAHRVLYGSSQVPEGLHRGDRIVVEGMIRFYWLRWHAMTKRKHHRKRRRYPLLLFYVYAKEIAHKGKFHLEEDEYKLDPGEILDEWDE